MKSVESPRQVKDLLGEKIPRGKARGVYPDQREVVTNAGEEDSVLCILNSDLKVVRTVRLGEKKKMKGLVSASGLTREKRYTEKAEGDEHNREVEDNPEFYNNEQP